MSTIKTNQLAHTANGAATYTLPQTDGSAGQVLKTDGSGNLSWVTLPSSGISMIDTYNLTSSQNLTGATWNYLKTNFSRVNGAYGTMNVTGLGTGLGTTTNTAATNFTFPSTGYYEVKFTATVAANTSSSHDYVYTAIHIAKDGSTFDNTIQSIAFIYSSSATVYETQTAQVIIDVTNTSNDKFYLAVMPENSSQLLGSSDKFYTYLQVKKLAET